jgi:adenylate kinase family enzyme
MERVVIIGNSGGGKSVLARRLAALFALPLIEIDGLLWREGWQLVPNAKFRSEHSRVLAGSRWIIDGLGTVESIPERLASATDIVLVDFPLWIHFWLAAERQKNWTTLEHPPAGIRQMPPTKGLFETIWRVHNDWMPEIRRLVRLEEERGKRVFRLETLTAVDEFPQLPAPDPAADR